MCWSLFLSKIDPTKDQYYIDFGAGATKRTINATLLAQKLGPEVSKALIGLHAFTGCDFIPCFRGKGKVRPFSVMNKNEKMIAAFGALGQEESVPADVAGSLEAFVCRLYGSNLNSVNEARVQTFLKNAEPMKGKSMFEGMKKIDPAQFPPCACALERHIARTNYVALLWRNSHLPKQTAKPPEEMGWLLTDSQYIPEWDNKAPLPKDLDFTDSLEEENEDEDEDEENFSSSSSDDSGDSD